MKQSRTNPGISGSLNQRLNSYALAAGAAGVSLLALAQPADAEVIFTPTHAKIGFRGSYSLDLNNDGIVDFKLKEIGNGVDVCDLYAPVLFNGIEGIRPGTQTDCYCTYARALNRGAKIGPGQRFFPSSPITIAAVAKRTGGTYSSIGQWGNVANRFLGLWFKVNGEKHYAWVRLSVRVQGISITALVTGYAYETIPDKPLRAGQTQAAPDASADMAPADPGTLGGLAQGSQGLQAWRKRPPAQQGRQEAAPPKP